MQREDFRLRHQLRVRWSEVDMQGIVFNGHYLTYADIGITEYFRALSDSCGGNTGAKGGDFFAVRTLLEYRSPAENDDLLDVHVRIARLGNSSMLFAIALYRDDTLLLTGEITYVYADQSTRRPKPIPARFRQAVKGYEKTAPEDAAR